MHYKKLSPSNFPTLKETDVYFQFIQRINKMDTIGKILIVSQLRTVTCSLIF